MRSPAWPAVRSQATNWIEAVPVNPAAGTNRSRFRSVKSKAASFVTGPTSTHLLPPSEYCQVPLVLSTAVIAIPLRAFRSGSVIAAPLGPNSFDTASPDAGFAPALTGVKVGDPLTSRVGAVFATATVRISVPALNADPRAGTWAPVVPVVRSQALKLRAAEPAVAPAAAVNRTSASAPRSMALPAETVGSNVQFPPAGLNSQVPWPVALTMATPTTAPSTSVALISELNAASLVVCPADTGFRTAAFVRSRSGASFTGMRSRTAVPGSTPKAAPAVSTLAPGVPVVWSHVLNVSVPSPSAFAAWTNRT